MVAEHLYGLSEPCQLYSARCLGQRGAGLLFEIGC
jgi:hypothetical protein